MSKNFSYEDALTPPNAGNAFSYEDATGEKPQRTWGEAIKDTGAQLAEGVNTTLGAIPSVVAPQSKAAGFFRDNAEHWRDKQSDVLKGRIAETDKRIAEAGKDGVLSQIGTAASEYWNDPAQAARLVATNLPSMAATLGTGAAAGFAAKGVAAARGLDAANKAALAAKYGTTTAYATNAALNAGGARGEAFEDLQKAAIAQGMTPEQAEQAGVSGSILPGVVGGVAGAISGKIGLEKAILGQATTGAAMRKAAGAFGAELAGEQIEELSPKVATNYQAGRIDPGRTLTDDLGRTVVETAIGSGPGAVVAGGASAMRTGETPPPPGAGEPTTSPGAADPDAPQTPPTAPPEAPDLTTAPGAGVARDGMDFTREVDTSGLSLQDPAEIERAKAATVDYQPGDTTPQWDTQLGATGQRQGLDMPAPEIDTTGIGLDPIRQMVKQAADAGGALSAAALTAIDVGATPVQFVSATGRDLQVRRTGPGVANESNVIDVQGRVVEDRAIGTQRRLTAQESARESGAIAFREGVPRSEIAAIPNVIHRAQQLRGYDDAAQKASSVPALPAPTNLREGLERIRAQKQEAANAQGAAPATAPAAAPVPAAGTGAVEAAGLPPRGREGYDTPVTLDAASLKALVEKTRGTPLVDKPEKLKAWRNGTAKTDPAKFPIELAITPDGRLDVNDGRHRIALAAERGETVEAFIDGKDAQYAQQLVSQPSQPQGAASVATPDQAQQASPQPAQAAAAPATKPAPELASAPAPAGTPEVRALSNGAPTANIGAQAAPAAGTQGAAPAESAEQRTQRVAQAGEAWTRMPAAQREALAGIAAGLNPIQRKRVPSAAWADLNRTIQRNLADAMGTTPALDSKANQPPTQSQQAQAETEKDSKASSEGENRARASGEGAAMQGYAMFPPSNIRKRSEREAWEEGWLSGKRKRAIALEGLEAATVGDRVARPTLNSKNSVVWREDRSGKDYDTAAEARAGMERSEAALRDLDDVKPSSDGPQAGAATATASTVPAGGNRVQAAGLTNGTPTQNDGAQAGQAQGQKNEAQGPRVILQNRDRSTPSSIAQMRSIAANPDYGRLGFSRDFANGAPVVAGGTIEPTQLGRKDVATASDGRRIPVQYAVVEAANVLPSNRVDGTPNADYGQASIPAVRAIAGNGRIAGLQAAYQGGNAATYRQELVQDAALHGIDPAVISTLQHPVLVRVMPETAVTADIGDVSNSVGNMDLSAVEQANNDANRVSLDALQFAEDGSITQEAVRQFVRAMPQAEQGGLLDTNGQPTRQAVDRLNAAVFAKAYGNDDLVRLFAQAQDPEARNVLSALAQVAPKMARLEGAGALDIRELVAQAAEIAVNARRQGVALAKAARQLDMTADPDVGVILRLFAENPRSVRPVVESLGRMADMAYTEATKPAEDMFGAVPRASRADIINQLRPENERGSQEALENTAGREPVAVDAVGQANEPARPAALAEAQAGRAAEDGATLNGQVSEQGAEYSVRQQFSLFGQEEGDQLQLFIDSGPVPSQAGAGAIQAQRESIEALADMESIASILAKSLSRDYAARQRVSLVGQKVSTSEDLAVLAQVYRDPRFETFRLVFTDNAGNVVSQLGITSRLPASAEVIVGGDLVSYLRDVAAAATKTGATSYYMLHNHPSGQATPSGADIGLTRTFAQWLPGLTLRSHVVIDTNEYSVITSAGRVQKIQKDFPQTPSAQPSPMAGRQITSPQDVVQMAQSLQVDSGAITLIATDAQFRVKAITTVPPSILKGSKGMVRLRVARALMRLHSSNVFAVGRDDVQLRKLGGIVVDALHVSDSGRVNSLASQGLIASKTQGAFPNSRRPRVTGDSSEVFNYLRFDPAAKQSAGARAVQEQQTELDWLTSYTSEEVTRRQDETSRVKAAAKRAEDAAAKAEEDRKRIAQASVRAADRFELGQDPLDSLTGQGGLAFSFAGSRAATADAHALVTAQDRLDAGEDPETVRQETGWHRGPDGRMRFEISDNEAKVNMALLANLHRGGFAERGIEHVSYRQEPDGTYSLTLAPKSPQKTSDFVSMRGIPENLLPSLLPQSALDAIEQNHGEEDMIGPNLEDARRVRAPFQFMGFNALPLDVVMDHPKLFAAYPALREILVQVDPKMGSGASFAVTDYVDGTVRNVISIGNPLAKDVDSALLHEIQHGIQDIEGFATGGTPEQFGSVYVEELRQRLKWQTAHLRSAQKNGGIDPVSGEDENTWLALARETANELGKHTGKNDPRYIYGSLAGEVEARNTQARQGMTDEQRRATPPSQTADVADSEVIVMFNGKEMANAPMPANAAPDAATTAQPLRTPAATIRAAITKAYGKLLGQLESKGLVTLTQTQEQAIDAAARARAKKTGGDVAQIKRSLMAAVRRSISVWHGTPHRGIEKTGFTLNKIGTGEGAQAYGWGMYFAGDRSVAENYRLQLSQGKYWYDGAILPNESRDAMAARILDGTDGDKALAISQIGWYPDAAEFENEVGQIILGMDYEKLSRTGQLYSLEIPVEESDLLDWNKPLSEQSQKVRNAMLPVARMLYPRKDIYSDDDLLSMTGEFIYKALSGYRHGGPQAASSRLQAAGIPGLRYLDGNSRSAGEGSHNYVIWDEALMTPDAANIDPKFSADGSIQGFFDPQTGQSFLIADNLSAEAAPGVLMHEVGIHMAADGSMKALFNRAAMMLKLQRGNPFMKAVQDRMDAAGETSGEEAAAYIAEAYENDRANAPASVQRWLADLLAAVKAWMFKKGIMGADRLTVADIAAVARANARSMARDGGATGGQGFGTAFSRAPAGDQTQTDAFKRWFAGSRVVDADGKPLVVYHGTGRDFSIFDAAAQSSHIPLPGFYFSPDPDIASGFAESAAKLDENRAGRAFLPIGANVVPAYLSLQNPAEIDASKTAHGGRMPSESVIKELLIGARKAGHDGAIIRGWADGSGPVQYVAFRPEQIKSATGNSGAFDPTNPDIRFSRTSTATGTQSAWDAPVPTGFDDVIYKLQDKNIDLKRVVESITKATGQVSDSINAYLKEELFHKRAAKRVADFGDRELKPLMNKMRLAGLSMEDVEEYLHARHAKEANAVIAQRNPGNAGLQDGGSGMTNAAADNYFAKLDPAQRRKLEAVAKSVDAIIDGTRKLYVDYGLEDQAVVDGWANMYQHYIPLMREDKDGGMGTGQGFSVKGKETKGRTGSTRKVVDILANVAMQREKLIVRGEKNIVAQALVGLAQANPNPDFWEVRSQAPTERVFDPKTGVVVDRPDPLFKSRENVAVAKVKDANGKVTEQMVVFNEDNPRAVRMAAAMKNLDAGNLEGLLGVSAKITRYFAAINTQYNPVFGVVNLVRDVQGAMVNLGTTPLAGQQGKIAKDTLSALRGIYGDIRKTRKGGQATSQWSQLWEQMQDDGGTTGHRDLFKTSADRANDLKSILNPEGWMDSKWGKFFTADGRLKVPLSMAQKGATEIFGWLSDYNEAMENGVRLAAYKAALDKGMSREQAASLAKNLTVNFNRKGQAGMQAGAVYAFFNAAMQGTARIGQTLFDMDGGDLSTLRLSKTGKAVVYGGVMLGVMQALALSAAGFDDDDPPEFVRERSLIIPTGDKTYVSIPMPLGLHVIPGIGRHATEFALSGFDKPAKRAVSMVGMFADAFNPIGNAGLSMQTIAPTALDPLVALSENKDWTGKPIARVSSNKAMPGHTQWKDTATGFSKVVAEAINWVSGGNEYVAGAFSPTPDQIDYLLAQVGGGVAREAAKVQQTITTAMSGETLPTHKIPLVGRFVGNAASQASQGSAFYANLNKLNELETELKGLRKDGRFDEAAKLARENPQSMMIAMANRAERDVQRLRREKRELIANDASREQVRAKEDQITDVMTRLNEAVERRKAQAAR